MDKINVSKWLFEHGYNRAIDSKEEARLSELISEIVQLQNWVNDLQVGMYINCVYCGHRYGPDTEVPASMADVLKEHIEKCLKHPLFQAKKEIEQLKKENEWLLERCAEDKTKVSLYLTSEYRKLLIQDMQQALKEE